VEERGGLDRVCSLLSEAKNEVQHLCLRLYCRDESDNLQLIFSTCICFRSYEGS
jgi:hypothetical protein